MKNKPTPNDPVKPESEEKDINYCTECGEALELFGIADGSFTPDEVQSNFEHCCKTGKFKGDVCSKLFIISDEPDATDPEKS